MPENALASRPLLLALAVPLLAPIPTKASDPPACAANQLALSFDDGDGAFDGMSHSGTLMVLRNTSATACAVPGLPVLTFRDAAGAELAIVRRPPPGMHPGPVVRPAAIAAGATAAASLRWVSNEGVFDDGRCLVPARVEASIGTGTLTQPFPGHSLCGPSGEPVPFDQSWLGIDPAPAGTR